MIIKVGDGILGPPDMKDHLQTFVRKMSTQTHTCI